MGNSQESQPIKLPRIHKLNVPDLISTASQLPCSGSLVRSPSDLVYLDIDDAFGHELYPLIQLPNVNKADYFAEDGIGAHVTVIYPEENTEIDENELDQEHHFTIKEFVSAEIGAKTYYVLLVESPSLLALRRKYHLPDLLCFKDYAIGFHVTIATAIT